MFKSAFRTSLICVAVAVASGSLAMAEDAVKCKLATKAESDVGKACAEGGVKKAKGVMKDMVKRAKAAGTKFDCDDCHKEDDFSQLTADGAEKFKKLLAAIAKK